MLEELDYEDEIPSGHNDGECNKSIENPNTEIKVEEEKDSDSDTGEILDDEEPNDLEEGEIKESTPTTKKNSDSVCRFFQRGTCMFGSQCQFLHVYDKVYKFLDIKPMIKTGWNGMTTQPFPPPSHFYPQPFPPKIDIQTKSWERGIENAKQFLNKCDFERADGEFGDYEDETDWDSSLAQAKALISNVRSKRKDSKTEKSNVESKDLKSKRHRKPSPENRYHSPDIPKSQHSQENNYKRDSLDNGRRLKHDIKERSNYHMEWVDPWRRSKSPKARKMSRSLSQSFSPSPPPRNRKRSGSSCSCSSSSSNFKRAIYGSPIPNQSSKKRSRSRSSSISPKGNTHSHNKRNKRHSYRRSTSRSFTRSLSRGRSSRSRSSSAFSSVSHNKGRGDLKLISKKDAASKKSNDGKALLPERLSREKSPHSDDGSTSDMTVSSLSCTSLSSISDTSSLHNEPLEKRGKWDSPPPRNGFDNNQRKGGLKANQSYQKPPYKPLSRRQGEAYSSVDSRRRLSPQRNGFGIQNRRSTFDDRVHEHQQQTSAKSHYANSVETVMEVEKTKQVVQKPVVKPPAKKAKRPVSTEELELLKYHVPSGDATPLKVPEKLSETKPVSVQVVPEINNFPEVPVSNPQSKFKIALNLQPKSKKQLKPTDVFSQVSLNIAKEGSTKKRDMLLQQLQAIEDAIARKKQPA